MSRLFEPDAEVLWYHNGERCYGTLAEYIDDDTCMVHVLDEDGEVAEVRIVSEIYLRDADDPDDPDPQDPTR